MVSARWVDQGNIEQDRSANLKFVEITCRERSLDPHKQLAIWISLHSINGEEAAADIAGVDWAARCGKESWLGDHVRAEAERKWRRRPTYPPDWPLSILDDKEVVWLTQSDAVPDRAIEMWNESFWGETGTRSPFVERPPNTLGLLACLAANWWLWLPAP
jgi:hypothetical protein